MMHHSFHRWFLPLAAFLLFAPASASIDLYVARSFYSPELGFQGNAFYQFLYTWGVVPAWLAALGAGLFLLFSFFSSRRAPMRKPSLYLILCLVVGSGVLVHGVFKDHWGRPRPKQTLEFGGTEPFRPFYAPSFNSKEKLKSFTCGHCSMGFYFFSLAVLGMRLQRRLLKNIGFFLAFGLGGLLSLARIAQGGHFFSDTAATALIMWETAFVLDMLFYGNRT